MAKHNELGVLGEKIAANFLEDLGYEIIESNWQQKKFEIDIIAFDEKEIVFVEVKTRSNSLFGDPEEAVTLKKQKHLIQGADYYLHENEIDLESRFDVVSIVFSDTQQKIKHIKDAFYPEA